MVYKGTLKVPAARHVGSNPTSLTSEIIEEATKWPLSIAAVTSIFHEFEDEDLRQMVLKSESFHEWPIRHFAAIEQHKRRQKRLEAQLSI